MKTICVVGLNLWFVDRVVGKHPLELVKEAIIEDGYWEDCEMDDDKLAEDFEAHFTVDSDTAERLQKAYEQIHAHTEGEAWAVCETFKAILEQFKL